MKKKIIWLIVGLIVLAAIGTGVWLVASKKLVLVWNSGDEKVIAAARVCGDDTITEYNKASDAQTGTEYATQLKTLSDSIVKKTDYASDPTCAYIVFTNAVFINDKPTAQEMADAIKASADDGTYPSIKLRALMGLTEMQQMIEAMAPGQSPNTGTNGGQG
jgi:hypothetical protein